MKKNFQEIFFNDTQELNINYLSNDPSKSNQFDERNFYTNNTNQFMNTKKTFTDKIEKYSTDGLNYTTSQQMKLGDIYTDNDEDEQPSKQEDNSENAFTYLVYDKHVRDQAPMPHLASNRAQFIKNSQKNNSSFQSNNQINFSSNQINQSYNQINQSSNQLNQSYNQINQSNNQINQSNNQINLINNQLNQSNNHINQSNNQINQSLNSSYSNYHQKKLKEKYSHFFENENEVENSNKQNQYYNQLPNEQTSTRNKRFSSYDNYSYKQNKLKNEIEFPYQPEQVQKHNIALELKQDNQDDNTQNNNNQTTINKDNNNDNNNNSNNNNNNNNSNNNNNNNNNINNNNFKNNSDINIHSNANNYNNINHNFNNHINNNIKNDNNNLNNNKSNFNNINNSNNINNKMNKNIQGNNNQSNQNKMMNMQNQEELNVLKEQFLHKVEEIQNNLKSIDPYKISLNSINSNTTNFNQTYMRKQEELNSNLKKINLLFEKNDLFDLTGSQEGLKRQLNNINTQNGNIYQNKQDHNKQMNRKPPFVHPAGESSILKKKTNQNDFFENSLNENYVQTGGVERGQYNNLIESSNMQQKQQYQELKDRSLLEILKKKEDMYEKVKRDYNMYKEDTKGNNMYNKDQPKQTNYSETYKKYSRDSLDRQKIQFYDSFMPQNMRIMKSPYHLFKHKINNKAKFDIQSCISKMALINTSLSTSNYK